MVKLSHCLVILSQTEIFNPLLSCFQGSDQVTCIIQDGNVVWSAAVPRCEGKHMFRSIYQLSHRKHCSFPFKSIDRSRSLLSLFSLSAPQKDSFSWTDCAGPQSGLPVCTGLLRSAITFNESDSEQGVCVLIVVFPPLYLFPPS